MFIEFILRRQQHKMIRVPLHTQNKSPEWQELRLDMQSEPLWESYDS